MHRLECLPLVHRAAQREPELARRVRAISTRHASNQAFIETAEQRSYWKAQQLDVFHEAAAMVRGENPPPRVEREADVPAAFANWQRG